MRIRWKLGSAYRLMRFCDPSTSEIRAATLSGRAPKFLVAGVSLCALALAGCAKTPPGKVGSKEYFPSSVYGAVSPRVVEDGQPVPRGGGRYLVGRPYTVAGKMYYPREVSAATTLVGKASWYGSAFHGRRTANGEVYDMRSITAAHPTWPLPSYARVTNTRNGRSIIVRINDRGPYHANRVMDVSSRVADALDFKRFGTADVKVDYVGKAGLAGSDDQLLMASLRTDGRPANLDPSGRQTMIAEAEPVEAVPVQATVVTQTTVVEATPREAAEIVRVAGAVPSGAVSSFMPVTSTLPAMPPLPPVRPLSLGVASGPGLRSGLSNALNYAPLAAHRAGPFGALKLDAQDNAPLRMQR